MALRPDPGRAAGDPGRLRGTAARDALVARALARPVKTIVLVFVLTRLLALAAMWAAATWVQNPAGVGHLDPTVADLFGLWDAQWYRRIAEGGYPVPLPVDPQTGIITYSAWAFYPAFPLLVRAGTAIGLPFPVAGLLVNLPLGLLGALLVWRIFGLATHAAPQAHRDRLALVAACLWCFYPATGVLLIPYSEALALVLIAATLFLLMRRSYWLAALTLLGLGYTRAVAPAMGLAILVHLLARARDERRAGTRLFAGDRWSLTVLTVSVAISALAWPATVGVLTGRPSAFFDVQKAWGQEPQNGPFVLWLAWAWEARGVFGVALIIATVAAYLALVAGRHGRWLPLEVRAWALAYPLYLLAVVRPITSMWRFLLLDFPAAALVASVAMRTSAGERIVPHWRRRVALVALALCAAMAWWTVAFLTYVPWAATPP